MRKRLPASSSDSPCLIWIHSYFYWPAATSVWTSCTTKQHNVNLIGRYGLKRKKGRCHFGEMTWKKNINCWDVHVFSLSDDSCRRLKSLVIQFAPAEQTAVNQLKQKHGAAARRRPLNSFYLSAREGKDGLMTCQSKMWMNAQSCYWQTQEVGSSSWGGTDSLQGAPGSLPLAVCDLWGGWSLTGPL